MAIKRTKYCGYKPCHKPIKVGQFCSSACGIKHTAEKGKSLNNKTPKWIERKTKTHTFLQVTSRTNFGIKKQTQIKKVHAPGTAKPKKRIRPLSKKRAKQNQLYLQIRAAFLINKLCPITKEPATEVHHKKGRIGTLLTDVRYFLAVSRRGHVWIETHPKEAEELGYVIKRTTKTE